MKRILAKKIFSVFASFSIILQSVSPGAALFLSPRLVLADDATQSAATDFTTPPSTDTTSPVAAFVDTTIAHEATPSAAISTPATESGTVIAPDDATSGSTVATDSGKTALVTSPTDTTPASSRGSSTAGPEETTDSGTPEVQPAVEGKATTAIIQTKVIQGNLFATVVENARASTLELNLDSQTAGSATIATDKADYAPTDTVVVTGASFVPNQTYTLSISSTDPPAVNFSASITSDSAGSFIYAYQLDGNYRPNYKVEVKSGDIVIAATTFTDSAAVREFSATISPTSTTSSQTDSYTMTFTNSSTSSSSEKIKSIKVVIPSGYSSVNLTSGTFNASNSKQWTATNVAGSYFDLEKNAGGSELSKTESLTITLVATSPNSAGSKIWTTTSYDNSSFSGNQFTLVGSQPTVSVTSDTTAPTTTDNIDGSWHNADVTTTLTCTDNTGGSGCATTYHTTDGSTPTTSSPTSNPFTLSTEGTYTVKYFSKDTAGNSEDVKTATNQVKIDKSAPTVTLSTSAPNPTNAPFTVTITFSEPVTGFSVTDITASNAMPLGGFSGSGAVYAVTVTPNADGAVNVNVASGVASDAAGNGNLAADQLSRMYDHTVPIITVTTFPTVTSANQTAVTLSGACETGLAIVLTIGGTTISPAPVCTASAWTTTLDLSSFADGLLVASAAQTDTAGNLDSGTKVVTKDTILPIITITNPNTSSAQNKTITASTSDGTLTMSNTTGSVCNNTLTFISYASQTFTQESDNGTKVCYQAVDVAGNTAYSLSNAIAGIDKTAPALLSKTTFSGWYNSNQSSTFTYTDSGSATCDITTEGTSQTCSVTPNICDTAGNCNSTTVISNGANIDKTAPTTPAASPTAGDYTSDQSVTLSSTDFNSGLAAIYYTLDGTTPSSASGTLYAGAISADKDLTVKAIAYDNTGNASTILTAAYGIPPKISAESSSAVTTSSTTITWTTDDPSTSRVVYDTISHPELGSAPNYGYANSTIEADGSPKVTSHSVSISGLTAGTTYYYRTVSHGSPEAVSAEKSFATGVVAGESTSNGGGGPYPAPVCNDAKPGSAPVLTSATAGANSVTLFWNLAGNPVTYYLATYGLSSGAQTYGNPNVGGANTTNYTIGGLSGGTAYFFKVRAGNGCRPGEFSNELSAIPTGGFIQGPAQGFIPGVLGTATPSGDLVNPSDVLGTGSAEVKDVLAAPSPWWENGWLVFLIIIFGSSLGFVLWRKFFRNHP